MLKKLAVLFVAMSFSTLAKAELDPELAEANNKNDAGVFLGGGVLLGQAYKAGGSSPGVAALVLVEPGFSSRRDSWNRLETSLELGAGRINFRKDGTGDPKVTMPVNAMLLAKVGYGWSMGDSLFNLVKVGAGGAFADYKEEVGDVEIESDGAMTGLAAMISYDLVVPMGSALDITAGLRYTHMAFALDDVKVDGESVDVSEDVDLNIPAVTIGMRFTF